MNYYDRYINFRGQNTVNPMPFIRIPEKGTDIMDVYSKGNDRMDKISNKYYGTPFFGWLIMLANPQHGMEFDIPDNTIIRVPYPLNESLQHYIDQVNKYKDLYGE